MGRKKKKKGLFSKEKKNVKKDKKEKEEISFINSLKKETTEGIIAIIFIVISIFMFMSPFEKAGIVGDFTFKILDRMFGVGYYLVPIILISLGIYYIKSSERNMSWHKTVGAILFVGSGIGILDLLFQSGGMIGGFVAGPLVKLFDFWVTLIILMSSLLISLLITFDTAINFQKIGDFFRKRRADKNTDDEEEDGEDKDIEISVDGNKVDTENPEPEQKAEDQNDDVPIKVSNPEQPKENKNSNGLVFFSKKNSQMKEYKNPPLNLLEKDAGKPGVGDIKANANVIRRTLLNFGIQVEMDEVSVGPSVTRYALKPAEGVKLSKIVALQNDLALALAAHPLRIEAPIPGKSLVGIEIPNSTKTKVGMGTMFKQEEFSQSDKPLLLGMGKGVTGKSYFANLAKAPHMLIAGATGSGKSVTIHALVTSLLYRNSPEMLKFIMVDPKRVELTLYNKIPHLLTPVITDPKKSILALKWAGKEMNRRYDVLQEHGVRDIESYHKNVLQPAMKKAEENGDEDAELPESMPFIVVIIDELADIMQAYPRELEAGIVKLAQMSRAVGIHLIISTQRPSVNVITGLIKANIPTRVALQVASQVDSRTILDQPGAEKLLGQGDMLYLGGEMSQPVRVQSAFISEEEVKSVVDFLAKAYNDEVPQSDIDLEGTNDKVSIFDAVEADEEANDEDDLYSEAKATVLEAGKASTSYLQRKLSIGYSRAAKIIDLLEEKGVIGPANGSKPREVLVGGDDEAPENVKRAAGVVDMGSHNPEGESSDEDVEVYTEEDAEEDDF
jgi:S-DNA-T family DNA segregation ATPase FtsK/SpoIIIE